MQNEINKNITDRFFEAINDLKQRKVLRGKKTFWNNYNINGGTFYQLESNTSRNLLQISWIAYLVNDFGISAEWIITGKGKMYKKEPKSKLFFRNKPRNEHQTAYPIPS
jgi:hypothetical protein